MSGKYYCNTNIRSIHLSNLLTVCVHFLIEIECKKGYFGPGCIYPCRFPNYGVNCQSKCECEQQQCDHTTGCKSIFLAF